MKEILTCDLNRTLKAWLVTCDLDNIYIRKMQTVEPRFEDNTDLVTNAFFWRL